MTRDSRNPLKRNRNFMINFLNPKLTKMKKKDKTYKSLFEIFNES